MTDERLDLGRCGEDAAEKFLRHQGLKILERNMRTPVGEIDIVAADRTFLGFVEVKTRSSQDYGSGGVDCHRSNPDQGNRSDIW